MSVLEAEPLVWLEAHAATTERLATTRHRGLLDDDLKLTIAATIAAAIDYLLALPVGAPVGLEPDARDAVVANGVLIEASRRLPLTLSADKRAPTSPLFIWKPGDR